MLINEIPGAFQVGEIYCYRDKSNALNFFCVPNLPAPERDAFGRPTLYLFISDKQGILQLSTHWELDSETLKTIKATLTERFPELQHESINLSMPPMTVEDVQLLLGDGKNKFDTLVTNRSSGFPPFATVFNVHLTQEQLSSVQAALNGRERFLMVRYIISLLLDITIEATITGNVSADVATLHMGDQPNAALLIEQAVAQQRLAITHTETMPASDTLKAKADAQVKAKAAAVLSEMARNYQRPQNNATINPISDATLSAMVTLTENQTIRLEPTTDVSSWFTANSGTGHIIITPAERSAPATLTKGNHTSGHEEQIVSLSFDAKDTSINFIQIGQGTNQAILQSPEFKPVSLPAIDAAMPINVSVSYSDGGAAYETSIAVPSPEGWRLDPVHLGLMQVSLDGSALKEAGAKAARVHIRYLPAGNGTEDDRTIYLQHNEWTSQWYVVTRSNELNGVLEYEAKITTADGSIVKNPRITIEEPLVKLSMKTESKSTQ